jgi:D-apiose dehydrogenase
MLQVGVIGAGYFSGFHVEAWNRLDDANLLAIAETNKARKAELSSQYKKIKIYDSYEILIGENQIDILDIATPPATHGAILRQAIGKVKTIICQKPFCRDLEEAKEMKELARESGSTIIVHENFRFQPWYRKIKSLIGNGELGDILQAEFRLRPGDGNGQNAYLDRQPYFRSMKRFLIHETGIHWIDVFRFLFGNPETIYADLRRLNPGIAGEDAGIFIFGYGDGRRATFDGNRLLDHSAKDQRLTMGEFVIEGSQATLFLNGDAEIFLRSRGEATPVKVDYDFRLGGFGGDCVYEFQKHVVKYCLGQGEAENTVDTYFDNLVLEDLLYESDGTGRKIPVTL